MVYLMTGDEREKQGGIDGWHRWVSRIDGFFALWLATFNVLEFSSRAFLYIRSFFFSFHLLCLSRVSVGLGHLHYDSALSFVLGAGFFLHSIIYFFCNFGG